MFTKTITPRFGDVDGLRHINNTRLPVWFELGREPFFRMFNPDMLLENWNLIMAHIDVDFLTPMTLGADIEIRTYAAKPLWCIMISKRKNLSPSRTPFGAGCWSM